MATEVTLTTELSRERLLQLRDEIDVLLGGAPTGAPLAPPPSSDLSDEERYNAIIDAAARRLRDRVNRTLQIFVRFTVSTFDGETFTWEDVARRMGKTVGTAKSWHRSLSKPMNRLATENPGSPPLIERIRWDGSRNHYRIGPGWREAIERTWGDAGA